MRRMCTVLANLATIRPIVLAVLLVVALAPVSSNAASAQPNFCGNGCQPNVKYTDCSKDVTDDFNSWLNTAVPDYSTINLVRNGCYLVNKTKETSMGWGSIVFFNKRGITIEGHGATIKALEPHLSAWGSGRSCTSSKGAASWCEI